MRFLDVSSGIRPPNPKAENNSALLATTTESASFARPLHSVCALLTRMWRNLEAAASACCRLKPFEARKPATCRRSSLSAFPVGWNVFGLGLFAAWLSSCTAASTRPEVFVKSVQVDPSFAYYTDRSPESIAQELKVNGYNAIRYIVTRESAAKVKLVDACRASGLAVSYTTFGNGVYSTGDLPPGWQAWKVRVKAGGQSAQGYTYLCMNHPDYRRWKKSQVVATLRRIPFDGFEVMESFWPAYQGPVSAGYGCVCDHCRAAFLRLHPFAKGIPNFTEVGSPDYYRNNRELYQKWIEFRAGSVATFLDDIVNGANGVRTNFPGLPVAVWGIADAIPDGVAKLKEWEGIDGALLVRTVRPDWYVIQTDWPDWTKADLAPAYVTQYKPFVDAIRAMGSKIPIQVQTDIGSHEQCRRGSNWISQCELAAQQAGLTDVVSYEYHLSRDIYEVPPRPMRALGESNTITIIFNKRLNAVSAVEHAKYTVTPGDLLSVKVDGNLVKLEVTGHPTRVTARDLSDDPSRRFFKNHPAVAMPSPVTVPVDWR
jgi:hypothetical protein